MSHTPGPWKWWTSNSRSRLSSDASRKDGDVLHAVRLRDGSADVEVPNPDDALLIEAAPELLEALIGISRLYNEDKGCRTLPQYVAARAAIAKATGGGV